MSDPPPAGCFVLPQAILVPGGPQRQPHHHCRFQSGACAVCDSSRTLSPPVRNEWAPLGGERGSQPGGPGGGHTLRRTQVTRVVTASGIHCKPLASYRQTPVGSPSLPALQRSSRSRPIFAACKSLPPWRGPRSTGSAGSPTATIRYPADRARLGADAKGSRTPGEAEWAAMREDLHDIRSALGRSGQASINCSGVGRGKGKPCAAETAAKRACALTGVPRVLFRPELLGCPSCGGPFPFTADAATVE